MNEVSATTTQKNKPFIVIYSSRHNFLSFLSGLLKQEAWEVRRVSDGEELLRQIREAAGVHLFIIDVENASDEHTANRALSDNPDDIPVLVLSSEEGEGEVLKWLGQGASDFISKPFDPDKFLFSVKDIVARRVDDSTARGITVRASLKGWVELTTANSYEYVARFQNFMALLFESEVSDEVKEDIRVAVDELGRNAVEWGNCHDTGKVIHLSYCLFEDRVIFKIEDEGEGFDTTRLAEPEVDPLEVINRRLAEGKRLGGFGTGLAKKIMDEIHYNAKGNVVFLVKYLKPGTEK